jgi:hypothetical protein
VAQISPPRAIVQAHVTDVSPSRSGAIVTSTSSSKRSTAAYSASTRRRG